MIFYKVPQIVWLDSLAGNTMPIFLMHTICAASFRAVLLKAGIHSPLIHISFGITVSFIGPVLIMYILRKIKLDFLVFPGKRFL